MPHIESRIQLIRGLREMIDADLAQLYGVETRVLVQAIKRNAARFPVDFMFQRSAEEFANLRSQFVISSSGSGAGSGYGGRRYAPYAFTEQGVVMLYAVLNSVRAVAVNIEIMRTFVRVRELAQDYNIELLNLYQQVDGLPDLDQQALVLVIDGLVKKSQMEKVVGKRAPKRSAQVSR